MTGKQGLREAPTEKGGGWRHAILSLLRFQKIELPNDGRSFASPGDFDGEGGTTNQAGD
jgi:hypothetical protein